MFLTIKHSTRFASVDDKNYERLSKFDWAETNGAIYRQVWFEGKTRRASLGQEILQTDSMVDHKNRDSYCNLESNLRACTRTQNNQNKSKMKGSSSKYNGVSWHNGNKTWVARITINGQPTHLGNFKVELEAAKSYNKKASKAFGEFANLNKDDDGNIL